METIVLTELQDKRYKLLKPLEIVFDSKMPSNGFGQPFVYARCLALKPTCGIGFNKEEALSDFEISIERLIENFERLEDGYSRGVAKVCPSPEADAMVELYFSYARKVKFVDEAGSLTKECE